MMKTDRYVVKPLSQVGQKNVAEEQKLYTVRVTRCLTPRCRNLAAVCCLGYCWTCGARRHEQTRTRTGPGDR